MMPDMLSSVDRTRIDVATQDRLKKAQDAHSRQKATCVDREAEERQDEV